MATCLMELWSGEDTPTKYVLRAENVQHQITRSPTIITVPGASATGKPDIIGYDLGIVQETITINGVISTTNETVVDGDPAYEEGVTKVYPGKLLLRTAVLYWWYTIDWTTSPLSGLCLIKTPLAESYAGIIQQCQFTLEPGHDYYHFSLVFRITAYPE